MGKATAERVRTVSDRREGRLPVGSWTSSPHSACCHRRGFVLTLIPSSPESFPILSQRAAPSGVYPPVLPLNSQGQREIHPISTRCPNHKKNQQCSSRGFLKIPTKIPHARARFGHAPSSNSVSFERLLWPELSGILTRCQPRKASPILDLPSSLCLPLFF